MKAILLKTFGTPENLYIGETEKPTISDYEILVEAKATALNRADTLQRKGMYPSPSGASPILGLEMAGKVAEIGKKVTKWKVGDRVCGLLSGGGYAEFVKIHEGVAMPIPANLNYEEAAAIPEVFLTAFQAIKWIAKLEKSESILIHAGASGVGTAAIQLAQLVESEQIIVTASKGKHEICKRFGAHYAIDYKTEDFAERVKKITNNKGVNVVIDFLAASYFQQNLESLSVDGRMVLLALMGGLKVPEANLLNILRKRLQITGSTLRSRDLDYKIALSKSLQKFVWQHFETGKLKPVIDSVYDWNEVAKAHQFMEENRNKGKIVLRIN